MTSVVDIRNGVARGLERLASPVVWRDILASLTAALTVLCAMGGLIVFVPGLQLALLAGVCAALISTSTARAASTAAIGFGVAVLVGPSNAWFAETGVAARMIGLGPWILGAAAAAAVLREVVARRWLSPRILVGTAIVLVIANMWITTLDANRQSAFDPVSGTQMPSFWEQLNGDIPAVVAGSDDAYFFRIYRQMRSGGSYYEAFDQAIRSNPRWFSSSVTAFREPLIFWFWALLPGPRWVVFGFLVLASLAVGCVLPIASGIVKLPLAIPAAAALAAYFVYFPVQLPLFSQEAWSAFFGVGSLAAYAVSLRARRWRTWMVVAVVLAVTGTLIRETLVFLPVAGLVAALLSPARRTFQIVAWGAGLAVVGAAYGAHALAARPYLVSGEPSQFASGGLANLVAGIRYASDMLGSGGWLVFVLAALGILGAILLPEAGMRAFALLGAVAPLVSYVFIANRAWYETTGERINYWGATAVPLLLALIPIGLTFLPGVVTGSASPRDARHQSSRGRR